MLKIHLDTDIGGDIDDLCALAMLLRIPDVEITAITTCAEENGRRAGYTRHVLALAGRTDIPVAAGIDVTEWDFRFKPGYYPDEVFWMGPVKPAPNDPDEAIELLKASADQGAALVGIGPYTNFNFLEKRYPGTLVKTNLVLMGGYIQPVRAGYPQWGNDFDYNIQLDIKSAQAVLEASHPTLIPLSVTVETSLRRAYLDSLRTSGPLGQLIARQAEAFADIWGNEARYGATCPGLPADTINFQHDSLACAIALGWNEGVQITNTALVLEEIDGYLHERAGPEGTPTRLVTAIDGDSFNQFWYRCMTTHIQT